MSRPATIDVSNPPVHTIDVEDLDLEDTIYIRVLRGPEPIQFASGADAKPSGEAVRKISLPTAGWCPIVGGTAEYVFDVIVADRQFVNPDASDDLLPEGAESSVRSWFVRCLAETAQ
jgi:hypothetical protein